MAKIIKTVGGVRVPRVYTISGSLVIFFNGDTAVVHTWETIKNAFIEAYGFTPSDVNQMNVTYSNGDINAIGIPIVGHAWDSNTSAFLAYLKYGMTGQYRVNYTYFYYY